MPARVIASARGIASPRAIASPRGLASPRGFTGVRSSPFLPTDLANLVLWLRADEISELSDNDPIATWNDLSGNGNDVTAAGAARPTYKTSIQNGRAVARFATDDVMTVGGSIDLQAGSMVYVVTKPNAGGVQDMLVSKATNDVAFGEWNSGLEGWSIFRSGFGALCNNGVNKSTSWQVAVFRIDGSLGASSEATTWENLTQIADGTFNFADFGGNNATLRIGDDGGVGYYDGDIGEIVIYQEPHNPTDRTTVVNSLLSRWAI